MLHIVRNILPTMSSILKLLIVCVLSKLFLCNIFSIKIGIFDSLAKVLRHEFVLALNDVNFIFNIKIDIIFCFLIKQEINLMEIMHVFFRKQKNQFIDVIVILVKYLMFAHQRLTTGKIEKEYSSYAIDMKFIGQTQLVQKILGQFLEKSILYKKTTYSN